MYFKLILYFAFFLRSAYLSDVNDFAKLAKAFAMKSSGADQLNCNFICPGGK